MFPYYEEASSSVKGPTIILLRSMRDGFEEEKNDAIYTDWANRHLSKGALSRPIRDISNEFRDYRLVSQLINVIDWKNFEKSGEKNRIYSDILKPVTEGFLIFNSISFSLLRTQKLSSYFSRILPIPINEYSPTYTKRLAKITSNLDGLETCLDYLKNLGLDCSKLTKTDIDSGNLGAVLQLLFLLSSYKQKLRQLKKDQKKLEQLPVTTTTTAIMPPAVSNIPYSRLPSPRVPPASNPNSNFTQMSTSRLQTPQSRISKPDSTKIGIKPKTTSGLRPPSTTSSNTNINSFRPSSRSSGNNNVGSTISTSARSLGTHLNNLGFMQICNPFLDSSSAYSSISNLSRPTPSSQIQKPTSRLQTQQVRVATTTKIGSSKLAAPKAVSTPKLASVKTIKTTTTEHDNSGGMLKLKLFSSKNASSSNNSPQPLRKAEQSKIAAPVKTGLKPPTSSTNKLGSATSMSKLCTPKVSYRKPDTLLHTKSDSKRCSKSSEEESGYAGFNSTSPASSSTEGSLSMHSTSSKSSTSDEKSPSSDDLTLNASIVTAIRQPIATSAVSPVISKPVEEKPTLAVKGVSASKKDPPPTVPERTNQPTIGVVSPIMAHEKLPSESTPSEKVDPNPEKISSMSIDCDLPPPPTPLKSLERVPPKMTPIRQPPTYDVLVKQGKITSPVKSFGYDQVESSASEDSIVAHVQMAPPVQKTSAGQSSMERRIQKNKTSESSGYASDAGVAMCAKMREKLKEYDDMTRRAQNGYPDNFEDSSSLSSGISDNNELDDISTDDLSGIDMATVASKHSDYSHFVRHTSSSSSRPRVPSRPSTSVDSRSRVEQENVYKLLSQCRTSQRGAATATSSFGQHSLRSPGYSSYSPHLTVSADKDTMSMHSQTSRRPSSQKPSYAGQFHSLDRKCHLQEFTSAEHRMAALLSPRRVPNSMSKYDSSSGSYSARSRGGSSTGIYGEPFQLHRLSDEKSPAHSARSEMGSQLSLASTTAYGTLNEKYEHAIRDMARDLECYKNTVDSLTKKQENYGALFDLFEQKLRKLTSHIDRSNLKPDEATRFRQDIAHLREISNHLATNSMHVNVRLKMEDSGSSTRHFQEGAGELLRQPSLESVASHRSSMSSSSKSSKQEKISLSSFGKNKKSWALSVDSQIRSSLSKFTKKKNKNYDEGHMPSISGSQGTLDNIDVIELRQELKERDSALYEVRLDNLDRAREVDVLKETVNKLKNENKQLKKEVDKLTNTSTTRASSRASLPYIQDDEHVYDHACSSTSASQSSKRSSGCNSIKVTVNVDIAGEISSIVNPDKEIIVGYLPMPANNSTWKDIDDSILDSFEKYLSKIDLDRQLGLDAKDAIFGYQIGELRRVIGDSSTIITSHPVDILTPTTTIRMFMYGAAQSRVDSMVLDMLLPRQMILQLVKSIVTERRLVLAGATGIGKSKLAKTLAAYVSLQTNQSEDKIVNITIPENNKEELLQVERRLEKILRSKEACVVTLDNIPKNRIAFVVSVFANVPLQNNEGPFVVCTVNRYQIPELKTIPNFKMSVMSNRLEGFILRYLRRRAVEDEYRLSVQMPSELSRIIEFFPVALQAVNNFIEKTNSVDVTVGPRACLNCPLTIDGSREWFIRLWNQNFIPYMERVARDGKKTLGRCTSFEDPTDIVTEKWPWFDGPNPEDVLKRLQLQDLAPSPANSSRQPFNPLESLIQLHATKHQTIDNF
ncbi:Protein CBR-UNC-53, isoform c [Caenorhabditis briggsae]|uniref:Protein CBR-UNC-53, isoform c n=1 Tax=Caenorhabditis briggsae TaxID=6238 RepID=H8WH94_CAEBR|nr:Protein CBR-UNC-53, isoform c [Caenorhabditis briggsae]CCG58676.1 Protein CBR-UNC-53, isoform c [Caenorhabditis briggsae]